MHRRYLLAATLGVAMVIGSIWSSADAGAPSRSYVPPTRGYVVAPDGGLTAATGTSRGAAKIIHDGMCFAAAACRELPQTDAGGTLTVPGATWLDVTVTGDGSGGSVGCMSAAGALDGGCAGVKKLREGQYLLPGYPASIYCGAGDAGCVSEVRLNFHSLTSSGLGVTICPVVPCE